MYDSAGNYVVTETDESGSTVSYTYDVNGNVTSVTDGEENVVNYTYDNNDQITSVKGYEDAENSYAYDEGKNISTITHNNFSYKFNYDVFSNLISTKIGNTAIVSNTYSANNGNLTKTAYANGDYIEYTYDEYDNITKLTSEEGVIAEFVYNKKGMIVKAVDNSSETTTYYYHDFSGGIICEYRQTEGGDLSYYFSYDADGNRVEKTSINGQTKTITSGTDDDGKSFVSNDGVTAESKTDDFGRTTEVKTSLGEGRPVFFTNYGYANIGTTKATTNLVGEITQKYGSDELAKYQYIYDGNGNIEQVRENGVVTAKYTYDELNQLVWSGDRNTNLYTQMEYDNAGNITRVDIYSLGSNWAPVKLLESRTYTYGDSNWCDKLTGYNGTAITYDAVGNPLAYRDSMTMSWQNGRQLAALQTADNSIAYKYDSNGMRTRKTDNNGTTNYYYDSSNNLIGLTKGNNTLLFYYNPSGEVTSFKYNGEMYYYIKNLQGDIVKIIDQSGAEAASYKYDSWGKITAESGSSVIRELNLFRYRGYVYDTETGLYYLQSRYYDPITGRFLNADDTQYIKSEVLSANLYTYCLNNPIKYVDYNGRSFITIFLIGLSIGVTIGFTASLVSDDIERLSEEYCMAMQFYLHSIFNREYNKLYDFSDNKMYVEKIRNSNAYADFWNRYNLFEKLDNMVHQSESYYTYGAENGEVYALDFYANKDAEDLKLSIGQCKVKVSIKKLAGPIAPMNNVRVYETTLILYDDYNFEYWDVSKDSSFTKYVNNILGYNPQELGAVVPYKLKISIKSIYPTYFKCPHGY